MGSEVELSDQSKGRHCLAVFAKSPESAPTKTRLRPLLGVEGAQQAHAELVRHTLRVASRTAGLDAQLWVSADDTTTRRWAAEHEVQLAVQSDGDLGKRMHHALHTMFESGCYVGGVIGTDCPSIDEHYLSQAFRQAMQADLVLAPAEDGGYGLILMRRLWSPLFQDVPWGSADVCATTLERARQLGLCCYQMPVIWDVDEPADWRRYQALLSTGAFDSD